MKCNYDQKICQGCILVVKLHPPLIQNHIFSPNPQLKKQVILQVAETLSNFEEICFPLFPSPFPLFPSLLPLFPFPFTPLSFPLALFPFPVPLPCSPSLFPFSLPCSPFYLPFSPFSFFLNFFPQAQ